MQRIGIRTSSTDAGPGLAVADLHGLKDLGLDVVELSFNSPKHGVVYDDRDLAETIRCGARDLGMALTCHAPDVFWLSNPDRDELAETIRLVKDVLAGAAAYGAEVMVIHACPREPLLPGREADQLESLVYALHSLADTCGTARVRLAVETMIPGRLTSRIETIITAVDRVCSPWVGICIDTNHVNLTTDLAEAIRLAGDRIIEFHVNDNHFEKEEHRLPYEGAIDWAAFGRALVDIGYDGYMVMEPSPVDEDDTDMVLRAGKAGARLLAEIAESRR